MSQLSFFPEPAPVEPVDEPELRALAAKIPNGVRFGCCTWTYPGWAEIVYRGKPSEPQLQRHGLRAYARYPLFSTVEIDHGFYKPLSEETLERYAQQLPPHFPCASKLWSELTTHTFPSHPRLGDRAGMRNPRFLDPLLAREVVAPYLTSFAEHAGPLIFQLPPVPGVGGRDPQKFAKLVERLLAALPDGLRYAFELRDRALLTPQYFDVLRAHGAAHVINFWQDMPGVAEQAALAVGTARFVVTRLLQPYGSDFEGRRSLCTPFNRIVDPQPRMRKEAAQLIDDCLQRELELFVLVDNKAEGSSPLTVRALVEALTSRR